MPQAPTRIKSPLLALALLLLAAGSFCASAHAQIPSTGQSCRTHSASDDLDCITATVVDDDALRVCDDPFELPNDFDIDANPWVDRAVRPSGTEYGAAQFAEVGFDATPVRPPAFVRVRQPQRLSDTSYLREQIRERAPPSLT